MALITFLSDLGTRDHYVAAVKAGIFSQFPQAQVVDISHRVEPFNLAQAAFLVKASFATFPPGTVHLIAVDSTGSPAEKFIIALLQNHYFVLTDNGLLGLISEQPPEAVYEITAPPAGGTFPEKNKLAVAAALLASGKKAAELGQPTADYQRKLGRQLRAVKNQISGHVIYIDHYGNLVSNIEKQVFEQLAKGRSYSIQFGRETADRLSSGYQADDGDCVVLFNDLGLLEIAISKGSAADLLGLQYDSPVTINFSPPL